MATKAKHSGNQKQIKILVVEDDPDVVKQYDFGLPDTIFLKEFAMDGEEAISAYKSMEPDIILLDIMLPKESGIQILKKIRHKFKDKSTTIIMATGLAQKKKVEKCIKLGISGYILKPINPKEIGKKILAYYKMAK